MISRNNFNVAVNIDGLCMSVRYTRSYLQKVSIFLSVVELNNGVFNGED